MRAASHLMLTTKMAAWPGREPGEALSSGFSGLVLAFPKAKTHHIIYENEGKSAYYTMVCVVFKFELILMCLRVPKTGPHVFASQMWPFDGGHGHLWPLLSYSH